MALKQVKNKIISTKKTGQVTKAMESVSAVKMRKSQERAFAARPYVHTALRILMQLAASQEGLSHPLTFGNTSSKTLLIIITSDKGLAGSVNSAVLKRAEQFLTTHKDVDTICIGRKAADFARRTGLSIVHEYTNVHDDISVADVTEITRLAMESFSAAQYGKVAITYQNFLSTFEQEATLRAILPLDPTEIHYILRGIRPRAGKWSHDVLPPEQNISYTVEPSAGAVLDALIPQLVQVMVYHALLESKASEHSARMVAMKNATDKSKEVIKALTIKYNKERQATITAEVSEITAGVEAMK